MLSHPVTVGAATSAAIRGGAHAPADDYGLVHELLARPFVFVAGKGGVGKTTVAAALGLAAMRGGRRPLVCELGGAACPPGVPTVGIDPERALGEWLTRRIGGTAAALLRDTGAPAFCRRCGRSIAGPAGRPSRWPSCVAGLTLR
jgi:hypothetical protein